SYRIYRSLHSFPTRRSSDLLIFFDLGFAPTQHRIIDEIYDPKADGKHKYILQPGRHKVIQFGDPIIAMVLKDLSFGLSFFFSRRSEEHTSDLQSREKLVCRL